MSVAPATAREQVNLEYREGNSDKVYHVWIEPKGAGWVVNYAYGRRGATLQTGSKTPQPVDEWKARRVFDDIVAEKSGKGYQPMQGQAGAQYIASASQERVDDAIPVQLLTPCDEKLVPQYVRQAGWWAQPKHDGKRMLLRRSGDAVIAQNRSLKPCGFPGPWVAAMRALPLTDVVFDGEAIGDDYHIFDLLKMPGLDLRPYPFRERWALLERLAQEFPRITPLHVSPIAKTEAEKHAMWLDLKTREQEGIVFKRDTAPYVGDRTELAIKVKFWKSCTAVVLCQNEGGPRLAGVPTNIFTKQHGKRSVQMGLLADAGAPVNFRRVGVLNLPSKWVNVGDCSIPPNHPVPPVGALIEVRYLYAYPGTHKLVQPQYEGERDDVAQADCLLSQLQYKNGENGDEG